MTNFQQQNKCIFNFTSEIVNSIISSNVAAVRNYNNNDDDYYYYYHYDAIGLFGYSGCGAHLSHKGTIEMMVHSKSNKSLDWLQIRDREKFKWLYYYAHSGSFTAIVDSSSCYYIIQNKVGELAML